MVLGGSRRGVADDLPLHAGREPRAAHAAQAAVFQGRNHAGPVARFHKLAHDGVSRAPRVRIGGDICALRSPGLGWKLPPRQHIARHAHGCGRRHVGIDQVVHANRGSLVAAAEAGDIADDNLFGTGPAKGLLQGGFHLGAAANVAGHVTADTDVHSRRRRESKMGIETCYRVDLAERNLDFSREQLQLLDGQVAVLVLNLTQFFEHVRISSSNSAS